MGTCQGNEGASAQEVPSASGAGRGTWEYEKCLQCSAACRCWHSCGRKGLSKVWLKKKSEAPARLIDAFKLPAESRMRGRAGEEGARVRIKLPDVNSRPKSTTTLMRPSRPCVSDRIVGDDEDCCDGGGSGESGSASGVGGEGVGGGCGGE